MANVTPRHPLLLTEKFLPGLGEQHETSLKGVGYCIITATLACNTATTAAQLLASAPNTGVGAAFGPVVHSLGTAPALTIAQMVGPAPANVVSEAITYQYCTADNSAVYMWAKSWTGATVGVNTRFVCIR